MTTDQAPAWVTAAMDQRVAEIRPAIDVARATRRDLVMTPLRPPPSDVTPAERAAWEQSCDRCGTVVPGQGLTLGMAEVTVDGVAVMLAYGACPRCQ